MDLSDVRDLFDYTEWANRLACDAAARLGSGDLRRETRISHGSVFGTLLHMAGAEWIWLERWQGRSPAGEVAWNLWKPEHCRDLEQLDQQWADLIATRREFLKGLDEEKLHAEVPFILLNGDANSMRLVDQMQHVANHATLHRGQVVGMIRQFGIIPPSTDLLFFLRSEIPA
ncbi:MAG TPA: DinB family protein [Pyrinomonadaceae bacterium]|nr:DinB family protein [Pyrinomonadaceae bacterium]